MPEWLLPALSFVGGCALTYFLLRLRFERFEAMDTRREHDWNEWRGRIDRWVIAKEQHDRDWRHDEYSKAIDAINARLLPLVTEVSQIKDRVARLDSKIFNGHGATR